MKTLVKGTRIICPGCERLIAFTIQEMHQGEIIKRDNFSFNNCDFFSGQAMDCPDCKTPFALNGKLHTDEGWL